jgi:hypothetical protein
LVVVETFQLVDDVLTLASQAVVKQRSLRGVVHRQMMPDT